MSAMIAFAGVEGGFDRRAGHSVKLLVNDLVFKQLARVDHALKFFKRDVVMFAPLLLARTDSASGRRRKLMEIGLREDGFHQAVFTYASRTDQSKKHARTFLGGHAPISLGYSGQDSPSLAA